MVPRPPVGGACRCLAQISGDSSLPELPLAPGIPVLMDSRGAERAAFMSPPDGSFRHFRAPPAGGGRRRDTPAGDPSILPPGPSRAAPPHASRGSPQRVSEAQFKNTESFGPPRRPVWARKSMMRLSWALGSALVRFRGSSTAPRLHGEQKSTNELTHPFNPKFPITESTSIL